MSIVVFFPATLCFCFQLLAAVLTSISRKARIASPCVLFFFWTLSLLVNVVPVYHAVVSEVRNGRTAVS